MPTLFNVRRPSGKLCAQLTNRIAAEREVRWHLASGEPGPFSIEVVERKPWRDYGIGTPSRFGAPWPSAKLDEFRERYKEGQPTKELVVLFDTSMPFVCRLARRLGFIRRMDDPENWEKHRGRWTAREDELVNFMYDEGIGTGKIPDHHPRTEKAVIARLRVTAETYSTRSKFGRFIAKERAGRRKKTIHRVLEEGGVDTGFD